MQPHLMHLLGLYQRTKQFLNQNGAPVEFLPEIVLFQNHLLILQKLPTPLFNPVLNPVLTPNADPFANATTTLNATHNTTRSNIWSFLLHSISRLTNILFFFLFIVCIVVSTPILLSLVLVLSCSCYMGWLTKSRALFTLILMSLMTWIRFASILGWPYIFPMAFVWLNS
jgi:hypothetical protein